MPRGRASLQMVPPQQVRAAFTKHYGFKGIVRPSPSKVAQAWRVSERSVRRWQKTGLPLYYGDLCIRRDEWAEFEQSGKPPLAQRIPRGMPPLSDPTHDPYPRARTRSRDRNLSATPARRTGVSSRRRKT